MLFGKTCFKLILLLYYTYAMQDLESSPATASFSKNGTSLGTANTLEESLSNKTFFPCITTKNVSFSVNFGAESAWCEVEGIEGYSFIQTASEEHRVAAPQVSILFKILYTGFFL